MRSLSVITCDGWAVLGKDLPLFCLAFARADREIERERNETKKKKQKLASTITTKAPDFKGLIYSSNLV